MKMTWRGTQLGWILMVCALGTVVATSCATSGGTASKRDKSEMDPKDVAHFLPATVFDAKGQRVDAGAQSPLPASPVLAANAIGSAAAFQREVLLYDSPTTGSYFAKGGVRYDLTRTLWERFLTKYTFKYRVLNDPAQLGQAQGGLLILPSDVALTDAERAAITAFAARGGSVLATWMTGTRDAAGTWRGFDYMESLLNVRVRGTTGGVEDERYINPYGDTPVGHSVPAGSRIWTDLLPAWAPLRIQSANPAATMLTWSHATTREEGSDVMAFADNGVSRSVYLGWPERHWMGAEPKYHDGLLYDAVSWALRLPSASVGAWPYPYRSAYVPTIYMADVFNANDIPFATLLKERGLRGSYFVLGFEIDKSLDALKQISAMGNEIGYEGDVYETFADQPLSQQTERLNSMRETLTATKVPISGSPGFNPPMDGSDAVTRQAVLGQPISYMVTWVDAVDGCEPALVPPTGGRAKPLVLIPRLLRGVEEMLEDVDEPQAVSNHVRDLSVLDRMGCIAPSRFANQTLLSKSAQTSALDGYVRNRATMWSATGSQVANWWLERARVKSSITGTPDLPSLTVDVAPGEALGDVVVWINVPTRGSAPVLSGPSAPTATLSADGLRAAVLLKGLTPGSYTWAMQFAR